MFTLKERIGVTLLVLCNIVVFYMLFKMSFYSYNNTIQIVEERFANSNIFDPIIIWISSTVFILISICILQLILPDRVFGLIPLFRRFITTLAVIYIIYIGPIILLLLLLLFNASIVHITLVISVISFIGLTFKKGKELYFKIYDKISGIF